ncbi:hypothetical protein N0V90_007556 [Kalmusia sp. IMI 367209]|nr:hypothetical protein N0V90_007556 [Kalmusia sp. IMI 367209]
MGHYQSPLLAQIQANVYSKCEVDPYIAISSCCSQVTIDEFDRLACGRKPSRVEKTIPEFCAYRILNGSRHDYFHEQMKVRHSWKNPPFDASRLAFLPDTDFSDTSMGVPTWKKSHILSLPKELRLEIWKWVLTDPSVPDLTVNIGRKAPPPHQKSAIPRVTTWLQPGRNSPISLSILQTNRFVYEEALPILYKAIRFAPADHQGIFPLFLGSLSSYARSLIFHIKLHVPRQIYDIDIFGDPGVPLFHWAITCAQIVKMNGQLKDVEVEGLWLNTGGVSARTKKAILYPLCKIKARKLFGSNNDEGMDGILKGAEDELQAKILIRKLAMEAEAAVQAAKDNLEDEDERRKEKAGHTLADLHAQRKLAQTESHDPSYPRDTPEPEQGPDVHTTFASDEGSGSLDDSQILMEDWDVVSYTSGASTPRGRPPSYMSRRSSDSWTGAGSDFSADDGPAVEEEPIRGRRTQGPILGYDMYMARYL